MWSTFHKSLENTLIEASKGYILVPRSDEEINGEKDELNDLKKNGLPNTPIKKQNEPGNIRRKAGAVKGKLNSRKLQGNRQGVEDKLHNEYDAKDRMKLIPFDTQGKPTRGIVQFVNHNISSNLFSNNMREGGGSPGFPRTLAFVLFDILPRPGHDKQPIRPDFEEIFFHIFGTRSFDVKCAMLYGLQRNVLQRTHPKTITVQVPVHHHSHRFDRHHHQGGRGHGKQELITQTKVVTEIREPVDYFATIVNRLLKCNALVFGDLNSWITSQSSARTKTFANDVMERLKEIMN